MSALVEDLRAKLSSPPSLSERAACESLQQIAQFCRSAEGREQAVHAGLLTLLSDIYTVYSSSSKVAECICHVIGIVCISESFRSDAIKANLLVVLNDVVRKKHSDGALGQAALAAGLIGHDHPKSVVSSGLLAVLMEIMVDRQHPVAVNAPVCVALSSVLDKTPEVEAIQRRCWFSEVRQCLVHHIRSRQIVISVLRVMSSVAKAPAAKRPLAAEFLPVVNPLCELYHADPECVSLVMAVLSRVANLMDNQALFLQHGLLAILKTAAVEHLAVREITCTLWQIVMQIACTEAVSAKLVDCGFAPLLTAAMDAHAPDCQVAENCLRAVARMSQHSEDARTAFVDARIGPRLQIAFRNHFESERTTEAAVLASTFLWQSERAVSELQRHGVSERMVGARQRYAAIDRLLCTMGVSFE